MFELNFLELMARVGLFIELCFFNSLFAPCSVTGPCWKKLSLLSLLSSVKYLFTYLVIRSPQILFFHRGNNSISLCLISIRCYKPLIVIMAQLVGCSAVQGCLSLFHWDESTLGLWKIVTEHFSHNVPQKQNKSRKLFKHF